MASGRFLESPEPPVTAVVIPGPASKGDCVFSATGTKRAPTAPASALVRGGGQCCGVSVHARSRLPASGQRRRKARIRSSETPQLGGDKEKVRGEPRENHRLLGVDLTLVGCQRSGRARWDGVVKRGFLEGETLSMGLEGDDGQVDDEMMRG